jgi:hypothetical protein
MQAYQHGAYLQQLDAISKSIELLRNVSIQYESQASRSGVSVNGQETTSTETTAPLNAQQAAELLKSVRGYLNQAEKYLNTSWSRSSNNSPNNSTHSLSIIASAPVAPGPVVITCSPRTSISTTDAEDAGDDTDAGGIVISQPSRPSTIKFAEVSKTRRRGRGLTRKSSLHSDADVDTDTDFDGSRSSNSMVQPTPVYKPAKTSLRSLLGLRSYSKLSRPTSPLSGDISSPDISGHESGMICSAPPSAPLSAKTYRTRRALTLRQKDQLRMRSTKSLDALRFFGKEAGTPRHSTSSADFRRPVTHSSISDNPANVLLPADATDSSSGEEEDDDATATSTVIGIPPESPLPCEADLGLIGWRFRIPAATRNSMRVSIHNGPSGKGGNSEPTTPSTNLAPSLPNLNTSVPSPRMTVAAAMEQQVLPRSPRNINHTTTITSSIASSSCTTSAATSQRSSEQILTLQPPLSSSCSSLSGTSNTPISVKLSMEYTASALITKALTPDMTANMANMEVSPDFLPSTFCDFNDLISARTTDGLAVSSSSSNPHRPPDRVPMVPRSPLLSAHSYLTKVLEVQIAELRRLQALSIEAAWRENDMEVKYETEATKAPHGLVSPPQVSEMRSFKSRLVEQQQRRITNTRAGMNHLATLVQVAAATPTIQSFPYRLVAYQLTLIDATLFSQIPPEAILSHSARNPHPRVQASIDLFNYVTRLVEHSLLSLDEPAARASMLHRWSKVAKALRDLRSYQMLMAVVGGLQTPPIRRLKRTWAQVAKRDMHRVQRLQRLVNPDDNYSHYRELLNKATSGWHVPCLSVFLLDATYLVSACKTAGTPVLEDTRVQELLAQMQSSLALCRYPATPPSWMMKSRARHRPTLFSSLTLPQSQPQQQPQVQPPPQPQSSSASVQRQPSLNNLNSPSSPSNSSLSVATGAKMTDAHADNNNTPSELSVPTSEKLKHRRSSSLGSRMGLDGWLVRAQDRLPAVVSGITRTTSPPPIGAGSLLNVGASATTSQPGSGTITPISVTGSPYAPVSNTVGSPEHGNHNLSTALTMNSPTDYIGVDAAAAKAIYATRVTQFLIVHHLVTRSWMEDTVADRLSMVREPPRNKGGNTSGASSISNVPMDPSQAGSNIHFNAAQDTSGQSSVSYLRRRASGSIAKWGYGITLQERFHYKKDSGSSSKK